MPSPEYFPIEEIDIKVPTPPGFSPEATRESGSVLRACKGDAEAGKSLYGMAIVLHPGIRSKR